MPLHNLFEAQAARRPDAIAIEFQDLSITYRQLNDRADRLALHLRDLGVKPERRVGICLERSPDLITSILATLKAGGAYLPLDAAYPPERLTFMLEEAGAALLITSDSLLDRLPSAAGLVVCLDGGWSEIPDRPGGGLPSDVSADNLAYVMYTSGSTGRPKGVSVTHRNVARLVLGNSFAHMGEDEVMLQLAPVSFDASTFEIWGALVNGGRLAVFAGQEVSLWEIGEAVHRHAVTTLWLTSGLFRVMVDEQMGGLSGLRQLLSGGDVLPAAQARRVVEELGCRMINGYGPTENTTFSCCHTVRGGDDAGGPIPIGRPIANSVAYVLDECMEPVPVGVVGEVYVGGEGLARGYLGGAEMTAERFVPDPHGEVGGGRVYRTGDRGRYREDGVMEFFGRKDGQVKVRGYRVEIGEVEAALMGQSGVKGAAVVVRGGEGDEGDDKRLVGYVEVDEEEGVSVKEVREYLRGKVPEYMVPGEIVKVGRMPLTENGKVDRERLMREGEGRGREEDGEEEYEGWRTELERKVAGVWGEVLGMERVSIHANFFDLGGHSLLATKMVSQLQQALSVRIPLRLVFDSPTVAQLAEGIEVLLWMVESGEALPITAMKAETGEPPLSR